MKIEQLKYLFPTLTLHEKRPETLSEHILFDKNSSFYLTIPKSDVSQRELSLLRHLYIDITVQPSPWFSFFYEGQAAPHPFQTMRIHQLLLLNPIDNIEFAIETFFTKQMHCLKVTVRHYLLFEIDDHTFETEDFTMFHSVLQNDFYCQCSLFIGATMVNDNDFKKSFNEQSKLLMDYYQTHHDRVATIIDSTELFHMAFEKSLQINPSPLLINFNKLIQDDELSLTICTLFEHQGNLSSTAKALHVHRNTIQNRIQRIYTLTGIDIKHAKSLFFAYCATKLCTSNNLV